MKVGILGTGFGAYHASLYKEIPEVEAIKIFGRNDEKLKKLKEELYIDVTHHVFDILTSKDIDLVDICLPSSLHREYAIEAMKNGKNVFCETPVALELEDALAIQKAAEKYRKKAFVNMFIKFEEAYKQVYNLTKEKKLGKLKALHVRRKTPPFWGDLSLNKISPNLMIHELDFVSWLLGSPNQITVSGVNSKEGQSHVLALLNYEEVVVEVEASSMLPNSYPFSVTYEALFENGTLEYIDKGYENRSERLLKTFTNEGMETSEISNRNCYLESLKHVTECCGKNIPSLLSLEDAITSLEIALKIREQLLSP